MTEREALRLALKALEIGLPLIEDFGSTEQFNAQHKAITAIYEALAQPEQEPVACIEYVPCCTDQTCPKCKAATPPQRKPLSDEEIILIVAECAASHQHTDIHFARAIERAHGIKELV